MSLPDFLCIGAQKAGTSWLHAQLETHPGLCLPPVKELHFFDARYVPGHRKWAARKIEARIRRTLFFYCAADLKGMDLAYVRYLADLGARELFSDAWYRRAFDLPGRQGRPSGDFTPAYSILPPEGIAHLRALLGAVKIIYLIRAPLPRALSQLRMNASRRARPPDRAAWLEMADQEDVLARGDYRAHVPRWKAAFAPEDLLFLPYGRIAADPEALMREVEAFLGIGGHDYPRLRERVHASREITVPDEIAAGIAARIDGQDAFIAAEFGEDFARLT
ncbi:sulfotransferase [soil metagenome]